MEGGRRLGPCEVAWCRSRSTSLQHGSNSFGGHWTSLLDHTCVKQERERDRARENTFLQFSIELYVNYTLFSLIGPWASHMFLVCCACCEVMAVHSKAGTKTGFAHSLIMSTWAHWNSGRSPMLAQSSGAAKSRLLHVLPWPLEEARGSSEDLCTLCSSASSGGPQLIEHMLVTCICRYKILLTSMHSRWKEFEPRARAASQALRYQAGRCVSHLLHGSTDMSGNDWWNRKQATEGPTFTRCTRPERFETMIFAEKNLQSICLGRSFHEWSIQPLTNSKDSKVVYSAKLFPLDTLCCWQGKWQVEAH